MTIYPRHHFYSTMLCVSAVFAVARCPSVHHIGVVNCIPMAEDIVNIFLGVVVPSLVFDPQRHYPILSGTPSVGAQYTQRTENLQFSTNVVVYLGNRMR